MRQTNKQRFVSKIDMSGDCWLWTGARTPKGYGQFWWNGRLGYAHRFCYSEFVGWLSPNKQVDHLCHNRSCVRPDHLGVATNQENQLNLSGPQRNNRTGFLGVVPNRDRFAAMVSIDGKTLYLGTFDTPEEAAEVAKRKRLELYAPATSIGGI